MGKTINLYEILIKHIPTELYDPSLDKYYLAAMLEACEETVNLCSEEAETYNDYNPRYDDIFTYVDRDSILRVKYLIT